jgi:tetratricopeptide (TPR) repeat protein
MRKDLEDWLRGNENLRSATLAADRRKPVVPYEAGEWKLPVAFLPDLPIVFETEPQRIPPEGVLPEDLSPPESPRFAGPEETAEAEDYIDDDDDGEDGGSDDATVEVGTSVEFTESEEFEREAETSDFADAAAFGESEKTGAAEPSGLEEPEGRDGSDETESFVSSAGSGPAESPETAVPPAETSEEEGGTTEDEGNPGDVAPADYDGAGRRSEQRFEERWRRIELARQMAFRRQRVEFRKKYGRFIAAGVLVFLIAGMVLLTYGHLRRNSYNFLMTNAKTLYESGMYEESLKAYNEVSLIYPDRIDPFLGVAIISERLSRNRDAVEAYKHVLDLEPFYSFAQNELTRLSPAAEKDGENFPAGDANAQKYDHAARMGNIALLAGSYGEAARYFSDALALHSGDANVWVNLARAQAGLGNDQEATESLKTALLKDPANEEAKSRLADIEKAAVKKAAEEKAAKEKTAKEKLAAAKKTRRPAPKKTRSAKSGKRPSPPASTSPASSAPSKPAAPRAPEGGES